MKKPDSFSLPIKIIGLFIFLIGVFLSIAWIIAQPSSFEPWTVFLFAMSGLLWDGATIYNEVKQSPDQAEQAHQKHQEASPKSHQIAQINSQDKFEENTRSSRPFHKIAVLLVGGLLQSAGASQPPPLIQNRT